MAANLKRMPPPPPIATNDPTFNRWLHDLTAFIAEGSGGIDTGLIPGYDALVAQVNQNTSAIAVNTSNIAANTSAIAVNTSNIAAEYVCNSGQYGSHRHQYVCNSG